MGDHENRILDDGSCEMMMGEVEEGDRRRTRH
jgi:hypothetical protein